MKRTTFGLALLLTACPDEKKPAEHGASPVAAKPVVVDAGPVITKNLVPEPQPPQEAEVEMSGKVDGSAVKAATRFVFVIAKSACTADSTELEVIEQTDVSAGDMFTEMFFPQGTVGNMCLIALDKKGQQVGFAAYAKNPVTFQGEGEVEIKDIVLKVTGVKGRAAPKGL